MLLIQTLGIVLLSVSLSDASLFDILFNDPAPEGTSYSYDDNNPYGPSNWHKFNPTCGIGFAQSPINILTPLALPLFGTPLQISKLDTQPESITIKNTGHGAKIEFKYSDGNAPTVIGGPLFTSHKVAQAHWHWGENDNVGSEHLLNGNSFSAELHVVTYNSIYPDIGTALNSYRGLAVMGFFYQLDSSGQSDNKVKDLIQNIIDYGTSHEETTNVFTLRDLIKNDDFKYISYQGSLTTPDCQETVTWMVSTEPLKISSDDLAEFRKLKDTDGALLVKNYRPTQNRYFRLMTAYNFL